MTHKPNHTAPNLFLPLEWLRLSDWHSTWWAGNLKGCIDIFAYFSLSREFGRDHTILTAKLDIEKALLLQWVERVRLLKSNYDSRLDDERTYRAVSNILVSIRTLFEVASTLEQRYGLQRQNLLENRQWSNSKRWSSRIDSEDGYQFRQQ